jgi:hypothetical protein
MKRTNLHDSMTNPIWASASKITGCQTDLSRVLSLSTSSG